MIKHSEMMKAISRGELFNCTYCKKNGELSAFTEIKKFERDKDEYTAQAPAQAPDTRRRRKASQYESLMPFEMINGKLRELYTRMIVIFNGEEVVL